MIKYFKYRKKPRRFVAMTGLTIAEFDELEPKFARQFHKRMETFTLEGKERQNRPYVAYRNSPLRTSGEKLFFILSFLKNNPLQEVQGALFGMTQPKANLWLHCLTPVLLETFTALGEVPARTPEALLLRCKGQTLFMHDGVERPIPRPLDPEMQRLFYSGKAGFHTVKNNLLIEQDCRILFLTATVEGKRHDKKLAEQAAFTLPDGSRLLQDLGFQGFALDGVVILQPKKKPKGQPLSDLDKARNQWLASLRMRIEHVIGGVQRMRIAKDKIRNRKQGFRDSIMAICCALHNFRLKFRPWRYPPLQLHLFVDL